VRDEHLPAEAAASDTTSEAGAPAADTTHPAGRIRLAPARGIGMRVNALGGLAVGAIVTATPVMAAIHPTSGP
jgi:hypothetical protein